MSSPSEPVEMVAMSSALTFLPSRMIEPLPKLRSICESAASSAFDLSMEEPSTRRSVAVWAIAPTPYDRVCPERQRRPLRRVQDNVPYLFFVRNMFFLGDRVLAPFGPKGT